MASFQATVLLMLLASSVLLANAVENVFQAHNDIFPRGFPGNISTKVTLLSAPYYRNVSAGAAWVIPRSAYDLGARGMTCECFDPNETCCMAKSNNVAPFCIPKNSTCCSDAFCNPGETCCGDSCCPAGTICNIKTISSGCCPKGQICSSPPVCYDHSSPNCTNTFFPAQQCCPPIIPFCRDFQPNGLGCYAMSSLPFASTTMGLASPGFATNANSTETLTTTRSSTTNITETVIAIPKGSGSVSLAFPATTAAGPSVPAAITSKTPALFSTTPSSSITSRSNTTTPSTSSKTSTSALCFDFTLQSAAPCPPSTIPATPSTSGLFAPPGAKTFNSQGASIFPPSFPSLDHFRSYAAVLALAFLVAASAILLLTSENERETKSTIDKASIQIVPGSARKLRGNLGREIRIVEGSARKLRGELGCEIRVLEGSGRVLRGTLEREVRVLRESGRVLRGDLGREIKVLEGGGRVWKEPVVVDKARMNVVKGSGRVMGV